MSSRTSSSKGENAGGTPRDSFTADGFTPVALDGNVESSQSQGAVKFVDLTSIQHFAQGLSIGGDLPSFGVGRRRFDIKPKRKFKTEEEEERERKGRPDFDVDTIARLHEVFENCEPGRGVTEEVFRDFLEKANMKRHVVRHMFEKIDWASLGEVSWDDFCTYLQLKMGKEEEIDQLSKEIDFLPTSDSRLPHREPCVGLGCTRDGMWITASTENVLSLWTTKGTLKRHRKCISNIRVKTFKPKWATCLAVATEYSKVLIATGDREIQFFDMANFGPHCQVNGMDTVPMTMHYSSSMKRKDECFVIYGDQQGCVNVMKFLCMPRSLRCWKKLTKHEDYIGSISLDQAILDHDIEFTRFQVHRDWVQMVRYYPKTDQIVSCSKDKTIPLVLAARRASTNVQRALKENDKKKFLGAYACTRPRAAADQIVFQVHNGVNCFDFCPVLKLVASGGLDRTIRIWNCYIARTPMGSLSGHYAPIKHLFLCHRTSRLFSIARDKWVKVWHVFDQVCLRTVPWHVHRVRGHLRDAYYNWRVQSIAIVGDNIGILTVKPSDETLKTHKEPVTCVSYNPVFNHLVSASANSDVRVWDLDTGKLEFEFGHAHGEHGVSDMLFDSAGKRLITAGRDGKGKIWNYNNGHCLHELEPPCNNTEVSTLIYIDMRFSKFIMTAGWSHRLNFYLDSLESVPYQIPRLPTWLDDTVRGHTGDVLCSDFCPPEAVATGGYDGKLIVWDMESSSRAHLFIPRPPRDWSQEKLDSDCGVSCLKFLRNRAKRKMGTMLVSGGPYGHVYFWNTTLNKLMAKFLVNEADEENETDVTNVSAMDSDTHNDTLVTGDSRGYVTLYDITHYAIKSAELHTPPVMSCWQAHLETVTGVKVIPYRPLVVSCSQDCTVRLWIMDGRFVGTFGHHTNWQLEDELTFRHPYIPSDIWEANLPPDYEEKKAREANKLPSLTDMEATLTPEGKKRMERYELGLNYFARQMATIRKRRHLNDETNKVYSPAGNVAVYHDLRWHPVSRPPCNPEKPKITPDFDFL